MRACAHSLAPYIDWSLDQVLRGGQGAPSLSSIEVVQPVLFAVMVSLARLWQACGVRPAAVVGHSQGEIAAAHIAGGLSLDDAARLVALRSQILSGLAGEGAVASVALSVEQLAPHLERWGEQIALAGMNGPSSVVLAGDRDALDELLAELTGKGIRAREVPATVASHTHRVDAFREQLFEACASILPQTGHVELHSTVTGGLLDTATLDADYWYRNMREPVRFEPVMRSLLEQGRRAFVEVSPHPVLTMGAQETADDALAHSADALIAGSLRRDEDGLERFLASLGEVWVRGIDVNWASVFAGSRAESVELPTYAFDRQRHWPDIDSLNAPAGIASPHVDHLHDPTGAGGVEGSLYRIDWIAVAGGSSVPPGLATASSSPPPMPTTTMPTTAIGSPVPPASPAPWAVLGIPGLGLAGRLHAAGIDPPVHQNLDALGDAAAAAPPEIVLLDCTPGGEDAIPEHNADAALDGDAGAESADLPRLARNAVNRALQGVQAWLADERFARSRLAVVTQGAIAARHEGEVSALAHAPIWGLLRSAQSEHPGRFLLLDLDRQDASLHALAGALASGEPQLALRDGSCLAPRLARLDSRKVPVAPAAEIAKASSRVDPRATALITGGTGALGSLFARHLAAEHGVEHLLLVSRQGSAAPGAEELQAELTQLGAHVTIAACDVTDREQLRALLDSVAPEHPLGIVIHAAGALDDGVIDSLTPQRIDHVFAPKVNGAWFLHELTQSLHLSDFVLFSSAAGAFGNPGQGSYAAANTLLDALAHQRRAAGLAATSMAWGHWAQASEMTSSLRDGDLARIARMGLVALSAEEGLKLFDAARAADEALVIPVRVDVAALQVYAQAGMTPALLHGLLPIPQTPSVEHDGLARRLAGVPESEREDLVLEFVRTEAAIVLGHASPQAIEPQRAFNELGFDSLTAIELRNRLAAATGLSLPATLVFDYPAPALLADYLLANLTADGASAAASVDAELDRLEGLLAGMSDGVQRTRVTTRLQALLSNLGDTGQAHGEALAEKLDSATPDEVFAFIDQELGSQ